MRNGNERPNERPFDIICHDGYKPKAKLCVISNGSDAQALIQGDADVIMAMFTAMVGGLLESGIEVEDIAKAVAIAMHEAN